MGKEAIRFLERKNGRIDLIAHYMKIGIASHLPVITSPVSPEQLNLTIEACRQSQLKPTTNNPYNRAINALNQAALEIYESIILTDQTDQTETPVTFFREVDLSKPIDGLIIGPFGAIGLIAKPPKVLIEDLWLKIASIEETWQATLPEIGFIPSAFTYDKEKITIYPPSTQTLDFLNFQP